MARGQESKNKITEKILTSFEGSFLYNNGKEIRIPIMENGELIQIKVTLTAAKENVSNGADVAVPGTTSAPAENTPSPVTDTAPLSEEEKQKAIDLLNSLNF